MKLVAPNGKPSNLTPEQYRLVRTSAFKNWFGDWENSPKTASKIVDENGEPLVVWHTTKKTGLSRNQTWSKGWWNYKFIFNSELEGMNMEKKRREKGAIYFTDSEELSKTFGEEDNSHTFSFFLNFVNPIILDANNQHIEFLSDEIAKSSDLDIIVRNATDTIGWSMAFSVSNIFITSYSNRIKLADGTNIIFDGNNPDVRYADGGSINDFKYSIGGL
jgi:hypothetical protein